MKYQKRSVVVEAVQWNGQKIICPPGPDWLAEAGERGILNMAGDTLYVRTLEGDMKVNVGDWIIRGVKGELYPCKPDIFEETYDAVE